MGTWLRKRIYALAAVAVFPSIAFAQATTDQLAPITSALKGKDFESAVRLLHPALQQSPRNPQLWTLQGMALSGLNKDDEASRAFRHALTISPDYLPALEGAAQIEFNRNGSEARPLLERVLKLRPNDPTSHAMLGVLAYRRGECGVAVQHLEKSSSLLESQPVAMRQFGVCLLKMHDMEKATAVFQRLLELQPDDPQARLRLATAQLAAERPKDALATLRPLSQGNPDVQVLELTAQ